ncbi:hypothetical protein F4779DRAFT_612495 [Xylariaceae sp. FL0662B]|nr:hypothetical protein F4779DRAFT_612495 [Xylariaceae sp. FL0662B]
MRSYLQATIAALSLGPLAIQGAVINSTKIKDGVSSCGSSWMSIDDVTIGSGTDHRTGFNKAVDKFCSQADGKTVKSKGYLSMATELFLSGGKDPSVHGLLGYVYFEIHNKQDSDHKVDSKSCKKYLGTLSADGSDCYGSEHHDTKGGTYQVGDDAVSYHALANTVPPKQNAINKLLSDDVLDAQEVNTGSGPPLDPWPLDSLNDVLPVPCHSHNDYDHDIPLFQGLSAGCVGTEADVWLVDGDVSIGHIFAKKGRTLGKQYINPLKAIIDHNGGSVFKARPNQSLTLLVDFKTSDSGTLDAVVKSLEPLRKAGYLSRVEGGKFVEKQVTVVASGSAPFDRISNGDGVPDRDVFYDAHVDGLGDEDYNTQNSYYASADFQDTIGSPSDANLSAEEKSKVSEQVKGAHKKGLKVRYYNLPGDYLWEPLADLGVDRLNADDLSNTASLARIK